MTALFCEDSTRRQFISKLIPACAITCLGCSEAFAQALQHQGESASEEKHSFEQELTLTYKKLFDYRYKSNFIPLLKAMADDVGRACLLDMVRRASARNNRELGERVAKMRKKHDLRTFAEPFRNPRDVFKHANIYDIIEDTDEVFEMRVTECLTATVFLEADAADLGYAAVCHADFALPKGFNPEITLIRDKTLMEGHAYCNHRYVMEA